MVKKILVVDDEPNTAQLIKNALISHGFDVTIAMDGVSALSILEKEKFDLVTLDMIMPGMSGREVCENIRKNQKTKNHKVIFITIARFSEIGKKVLSDMDVLDYITKPFDNDDLARRVTKIIGS
jgi:DNA-binding response OmpR family regulator